MVENGQMNHAAMGHGDHKMDQMSPENLGIDAKMDHMSHGMSHELTHDDMMKMYFYFGYENVQMLLKNWQINTPIQLLWSCVILFFVTLFHEWLRVWRDNQATSELYQLWNSTVPDHKMSIFVKLFRLYCIA